MKKFQTLGRDNIQTISMASTWCMEVSLESNDIKVKELNRPIDYIYTVSEDEYHAATK